jgi:drug/metabolite transporter (DMT)-like permease
MTSPSHLRGVLSMLAAVATFSLMDVSLKQLAGTYPAMQVTFLRGIASLPFLVAATGMFGRWSDLIPQRWMLHIVRGCLSVVVLWCFVYAVSILSLADAYTIFMSAPLLITALSVPILGEHVGWRRWTAVLIGFCGVLIALRPSTQTVSWPAMIALGGSLSFAFLMLITRSLRATPDIVLASSQFGGTFLLGALMSPIGWVTPTIGSIGLFAVAGVTSVVALLCINRSLKLAPASVVVPYQYSMILWAVIFGFVVFGDVPSPATIVGAAIIIGAGLYIFLREQKLGREEAMVNPPV